MYHLSEAFNLCLTSVQLFVSSLTWGLVRHAVKDVIFPLNLKAFFASSNFQPICSYINFTPPLRIPLQHINGIISQSGFAVFSIEVSFKKWTRSSKDECRAGDQTIVLGLEIFLDHRSSRIIDQKILMTLLPPLPPPAPPFPILGVHWRSSGYLLSPIHRLFNPLSFCLSVFLSFCPS